MINYNFGSAVCSMAWWNENNCRNTHTEHEIHYTRCQPPSVIIKANNSKAKMVELFYWVFVLIVVDHSMIHTCIHQVGWEYIYDIVHGGYHNGRRCSLFPDHLISLSLLQLGLFLSSSVSSILFCPALSRIL